MKPPVVMALHTDIHEVTNCSTYGRNRFGLCKSDAFPLLFGLRVCNARLEEEHIFNLYTNWPGRRENIFNLTW